MKDLKIVFMGTPSFAANVLEGILSKYSVSLVVCQPDNERNRKGDIIYSPVKELAIRNNIEVFQPLKIRKDYEKIVEVHPDLIITCAYGQIIPKVLLDLPRLGAINVHGSILPKLRGGAPIHHALIDGYDKTGVTVMYMNEKMDAGDIIATREILIDDNEYLDSLYEKMSFLGRDLLLDTLPSIINGTNVRIKQREDEVTFGLNVTKEEEKIDFTKKTRDIFNLIRGLNSNPGAYAYLENKRMKIFRTEILNKKYDGENGEIVDITKDGIIIKTCDGALKILEIQLEGKKKTLVRDYLNGIKGTDLIGIVLK